MDGGGADFETAFDLTLRGHSDEPSRAYLRFHAERYRLLMGWLERMAANWPAGTTVRALDIGPGYQTEILRRMFPGLNVDTLGFLDPRLATRNGETHHPVDLNDTDGVVGDGSYDLVLMCEVIEHLYTSSRQVLSYVRSWIRPGGTLVVQTPNAVALPVRVKMAVGRSPFEPVRPERSNPGHFHEFTAAELAADATAAGFEVVELGLANYFGSTNRWRTTYNRSVAPRLPAGLRDGITMSLRAV